MHRLGPRKHALDITVFRIKAPSECSIAGHATNKYVPAAVYACILLLTELLRHWKYCVTV